MSDLLTVEELAKRLHVHPMWVYDRVWKNKIPHIRLGRRIRFDPDEIDHYLSMHHPAVAGESGETKI
jgi:excisionase family DNA binding protein